MHRVLLPLVCDHIGPVGIPLEGWACSASCKHLCFPMFLLDHAVWVFYHGVFMSNPITVPKFWVQWDLRYELVLKCWDGPGQATKSRCSHSGGSVSQKLITIGCGAVSKTWISEKT